MSIPQAEVDRIRRAVATFVNTGSFIWSTASFS
jgi:hypothetical protein